MINFSFLKPAFFILFFSGIVFVSKAQNIRLSWNEDISTKIDYYEALSLENGQILVRKINDKNNLDLLLLNSQLEVVKENIVDEYTEQGGEVSVYNPRKFKRLGKNIFFFYEVFNNKEKQTDIYAIKINPSDLTALSKVKLCSFPTKNMMFRTIATYRVSPDSSKIMLYVQNPWHEKGNKKIFLGVFNNDMLLMWSKMVELEATKKYIYIDDETVTNDGTVYVFSKNFEDPLSLTTMREKQEKLSPYLFKIEAYSKDAVKEIKMDVPGKTLQNAFFSFKSDGTALASAVYKNTYNGSITGFLSGMLEQNATEVKNIQQTSLPVSIIQAEAVNGYANEKDADQGISPDFRVRQILIREDGSMDYVLEFYHLYIDYSYDKYIEEPRYNYEYGDIIDINVSRTGEKIYTRIPKIQKGGNANEALGFYSMAWKNNLLVVYNDNKDNIDGEMTKESKPYKYGSSVLVGAIINNKGGLNKKVIFEDDSKHTTTLPLPGSIKKISADTYEIEAEFWKKITKNRVKFGTIMMN